MFATILRVVGVPLPAGVAVRHPDASGGVVVTEVRRSDNNVSLFGEVFDRDLLALYLPPYKLIVSSDGSRELFDLTQDAAEERNIAQRAFEHTERLAKRLTEISDAHPALFDATDRAELNPETTEALRALGYLD